jgi:hypothetical protein
MKQQSGNVNENRNLKNIYIYNLDFEINIKANDTSKECFLYLTSFKK